jgi:hypothetical protein
VPGFRSRPPDGAAREGEWIYDPANQHWQRYHDGRELTPYVRIGERLIWDLAHARRVPDDTEYSRLDGMALDDISGWLEVTRFGIRMGWPRKHPGVTVSTTIDLDALASFELDEADPEHIKLRIIGYSSPTYAAGTIHPGQSGVISMSMIFGREHESALYGLRDYLERTCERTLASPASKSRERPSAPAEGPEGHQPEPDGSQGRERAGSAGEPDSRPADPGHEPLRADKPVEHRDRPATEAAGNGPEHPDAGRRARPAPPTLTVRVETAPDTDEWLSFAATSVGVLISGGDTSGSLTGGTGYEGPPTVPEATHGGSGHG